MVAKFFSKRLTTLAGLGLLLVLYILEREASVGFSDGVGFMAIVQFSNFPFLEVQACSHFGYLNLLMVFNNFVLGEPFIQYAVMLSIVCSVATLWGITWIIRDFLGIKSLAPIITVLILGTSYTWWKESEIFEVYTLNLLFITTYTFLLLKALKTKQFSFFYWALFVIGISLWVHIQNLLSFPLFLIVFFALNGRIFQFLYASLIVLLSTAPILLIAILKEDQSLFMMLSCQGFDKEVFDLSLFAFGKGFLNAVGYLIYNYHIFLIVIGIGTVQLYKKHRFWFYLFLALFLPHFLFALRYLVNDAYVFYLPAYFALFFPLAFGVEWFLGRLPKLKWVFALLSLTLSPILYQSAYRVAKLTSVGARIDKEKALKGGLRYYLYPGFSGNPNSLMLAGQMVKAGNYEDLKAIASHQYATLLNLAWEYGYITKQEYKAALQIDPDYQ